MPHTDVTAAPGASARGADDASLVPGARPGSTTLLRAALRPRMLMLLVLLLAAAGVCGRLGAWQLDRAHTRGATAAAHRLAEHEAVTPAGLGDVLAPQTTFTGALVGRRVVARGVYEPAGQLLVRDRVVDGRTGFLVLTGLRVTNDRPSGPGAPAGGDVPVPDGAPVLAVVRGWVATADDPSVHAVPRGEVTVTGYLQAAEGAGTGMLPGRQVEAISAADLVNLWGGPIWTGYVVLAASDPAQDQGLALLPAPTPSGSGSGMNVQNLAYAAQWWIFGGFALLLWWRLVRDEASGERLGPA